MDVANSPTFEESAVLEFFTTSTRNLLAAEAKAGVTHHLALSIVGIDGLPDNGYFRAKAAQERLIKQGPVPYSILRATQFFEFVKGIADTATDGETVRVPPVLFQPMAAEDVAEAVTKPPWNPRRRPPPKWPAPKSSASTNSSPEPCTPGTTPARSSPTRMPATSAPS